MIVYLLIHFVFKHLTELLKTTDPHSCEISRYAQALLSDHHSLPGTLVGQFHTCTWETNSLDRHAGRNTNNNHRSNENRLRKEMTPKTDWYSDNLKQSRAFDGKGKSKAAYANGGYLLNTSSSMDGGGAGTGAGTADLGSSAGAKEHIVLSNVRQFIDGMKRYLLNRPDTQMMFAIQRERIKVGYTICLETSLLMSLLCRHGSCSML